MIDSAQQLEPCPWCDVMPEMHINMGHWHIQCANDDCAIAAEIFDLDMERAIAAWNRRTTAARVAELERKNWELQRAISEMYEAWERDKDYIEELQNRE